MSNSDISLPPPSSQDPDTQSISEKPSTKPVQQGKVGSAWEFVKKGIIQFINEASYPTHTKEIFAKKTVQIEQYFSRKLSPVYAKMDQIFLNRNPEALKKSTASSAAGSTKAMTPNQSLFDSKNAKDILNTALDSTDRDALKSAYESIQKAPGKATEKVDFMRSSVKELLVSGKGDQAKNMISEFLSTELADLKKQSNPNYDSLYRDTTSLGMAAFSELIDVQLNQSEKVGKEAIGTLATNLAKNPQNQEHLKNLKEGGAVLTKNMYKPKPNFNGANLEEEKIQPTIDGLRDIAKEFLSNISPQINDEIKQHPEISEIAELVYQGGLAKYGGDEEKAVSFVANLFANRYLNVYTYQAAAEAQKKAQAKSGTITDEQKIGFDNIKKVGSITQGMVQPEAALKDDEKKAVLDLGKAVLQK